MQKLLSRATVVAIATGLIFSLFFQQPAKTAGAIGEFDIRPVGADHRDAPLINEDPTLDINDIYLFVNPNNPANVVMAMTINPFAAPGIPVSFNSAALYQFKIDTDGDAEEDLVFQATFSKLATTAPSKTLAQTFSVIGPVKPRTTGAVNALIKPKGELAAITGDANGTPVISSNGIRVAAGRFEDPFFIDFISVTRTLKIADGAVPTRAPVDFFAGVNVSILIIEVPSALIKGSTNKIGVWGTTSRPNTTSRSAKKEDRNSANFIQVERMALPLINTVLIQDNVQKDLFNKGVPKDDKANFLMLASSNLAKFSNDAKGAEFANLLLPDILPLDVTSTAGFDVLNGRRPQDDVVDVELNLLSLGAITGDGVPTNDKTFPTDFPFFAPENAATSPVPPRN